MGKFGEMKKAIEGIFKEITLDFEITMKQMELEERWEKLAEKAIANGNPKRS